MSKVVLITGCSSGIGLTTALVLAKNNNKVYATMRNLDDKAKLEKAAENLPLEIIQLDVTDETSVQKAVDLLIKKEQRIDVLINNAGYGLFGPVETITIKEAKDEFDVNFFGLLRVTQTVLSHMRKQQSGHIINISSIAGVRGLGCFDLYNASKFAVEGLSEAMAPVLSHLGIKISLIEPGPVATDFLDRSLKKGTRLEDNPYEEMMNKTSESMHLRFTEAQSPQEIAEIINEAINSDKPKFRYQTSDHGREIVSSKLKNISG